MQYFIKRGEKVQGPFTREQMRVLAKAKKITAADLVSNSSGGPFQALKTVWESIKNPPAATTNQELVQQTKEPAQTHPQPSMPVVQERFKGSAIHTGGAAPVQPVPQSGSPPVPTPAWSNGKKKFLLIGGISGGGVLLVIITIVIMINLGRGSGEEVRGGSVTATKIRGGSDPAVVDPAGGPDPADVGAEMEGENLGPVDKRTTGNKEADKTEKSKTYVVPEKIENFPPRMLTRKLSDFAKEIQTLPFRSKDDFEKTDEYNQKMKAIWPAATLFGQSGLNRFVLLAEHDAKYDADAENLTVNIKRGITELDTTKKTEYNYFNLKNLSLPESEDKWGRPSDELSIDLNLDPAIAKELIKEIKIAFVVRLGPPESGFSPLMLTDSSSTPFDLLVQGIRVKGTLKSNFYDLWIAECSEVLLFRYDTGEILFDVLAEMRARRQARLKDKKQWEEQDIPKIVKEFSSVNNVILRDPLKKNKLLKLDDLTTITDEQAEILSKLESLHLSGVTSITDKQAEYLGKISSYLDLSGVTSITDKQAEMLSNVNSLNLFGVTSITDKQAKCLAGVEYLKVSSTLQELIYKYKKP